MTLAIALIAGALVVGVSVGLFVWARSRALAEAAQFQTIATWLGGPEGNFCIVQVALPPTCSRIRFEECMAHAGISLGLIFGEQAVARALDGTRIAVHFAEKWRDAITGQWVAGTALHGEVRVGSDLAALCHELVHVCQERAGLIDETHASWTPEIYAAIERYEAFARTVRV